MGSSQALPSHFTHEQRKVDNGTHTCGLKGTYHATNGAGRNFGNGVKYVSPFLLPEERTNTEKNMGQSGRGLPHCAPVADTG